MKRIEKIKPIRNPTWSKAAGNVFGIPKMIYNPNEIIPKFNELIDRVNELTQRQVK